ncbi:hypothetical protein FHG87_006908 [Trinorchestia longiramus]|nr:hypothetical protein FHG87_006908 [Trinorchestia longiramus]
MAIEFSGSVLLLLLAVSLLYATVHCIIYRLHTDEGYGIADSDARIYYVNSVVQCGMRASMAFSAVFSATVQGGGKVECRVVSRTYGTQNLTDGAARDGELVYAGLRERASVFFIQQTVINTWNANIIPATRWKGLVVLALISISRSQVAIIRGKMKTVNVRRPIKHWRQRFHTAYFQHEFFIKDFCVPFRVVPARQAFKSRLIGEVKPVESWNAREKDRERDGERERERERERQRDREKERKREKEIVKHGHLTRLLRLPSWCKSLLCRKYEWSYTEQVVSTGGHIPSRSEVRVVVYRGGQKYEWSYIEQVTITSGTVIASLPATVIAPLPATVIAPLLATVIASLPATVIASLPGTVIASLPATVIASLPATVIASLPGTVIASLPGTVIASLPGTVIASLPGYNTESECFFSSVG